MRLGLMQENMYLLDESRKVEHAPMQDGQQHPCQAKGGRRYVDTEPEHVGEDEPEGDHVHGAVGCRVDDCHVVGTPKIQTIGDASKGVQVGLHSALPAV